MSDSNSSSGPVKRYIAVVDDDQLSRDLEAFLLVDRDVGIKTYASGEALVADLPNRRFDCIVLDVNMPGISGVELQDKLRELGDTTPVVICTGDHATSTAEASLHHGASDYVTKPIDAEQFRRIVREVSQEHRAA